MQGGLAVAKDEESYACVIGHPWSILLVVSHSQYASIKSCKIPINVVSLWGTNV